MWGLDQGSALGLGSRPGVWLGVQNLGRVWGLGLRRLPESGLGLGSRSASESRVWAESGVSVTVLGRGPESRSRAAALPRPPHGPCSHRPGDGQRRGPMVARGGAARPMGGGRAESPRRRRPRRSGYLKKRVRYIWCAS